jgi:hypothetical protein
VYANADSKQQVFERVQLFPLLATRRSAANEIAGRTSALSANPPSQAKILILPIFIGHDVATSNYRRLSSLLHCQTGNALI